MRESIGGTMLFWIVLFFMSIFIAFLASVIKYARVYKMKNSLINYIERQEGVTGPEEVANQLLYVGYPLTSYFDICVNRPAKAGTAYYNIRLNATFSIPIFGYAFEVPIRGETKLIETGVTVNSGSSAFNRARCFYRCSVKTGKCKTESNKNELT